MQFRRENKVNCREFRLLCWNCSNRGTWNTLDMGGSGWEIFW